MSQGLGSIVSGVRTMYYPTIGGKDEWRTYFFRMGGFPIGAVYLIVFFALGMFLLEQGPALSYGNFAIGSNQEAARFFRRQG